MSVNYWDERVVVRHRERVLKFTASGKESSEWGPWRDVVVHPSKDAAKKKPRFWAHTFDNDRGTLKVFNDILTTKEQNQLTEEILQCQLFRQYKIQGGPEPRVHFLLHEDASSNFEEHQPGYRYGNTCMKSRPLNLLPKVSEVAEWTKSFCGVDKWKIGVNVVLYRGANDSINLHADDDQNESAILVVIPSCLKGTRKVIIQTRNPKGQKNQLGDEQFELSLEAGDGYFMDGLMQAHFLHGVQKTKVNASSEEIPRIAIVFRDGDQILKGKDSGESSLDLTPIPPLEYKFGRINGLIEGDMYSKSTMVANRYHHSLQKGVSGTKGTGSVAIVISTRKDDFPNDKRDTFQSFTYAAETRNGAHALLRSESEGKVVRVFRATSSTGVFKPLHENVIVRGRGGKDRVKKVTKQVKCRYDGLYTVKNSTIWKESTYHFDMDRVEKGDTDFTNAMDGIDLVKKCIASGNMAETALEALQLTTTSNNEEHE